MHAKTLNCAKLANIVQEEKEAPGKFLDRLRVKEETYRTGSILKARLHLGLDWDFELYAQYLWKQHTNWKTRPLRWKSPRASTAST